MLETKIEKYVDTGDVRLDFVDDESGETIGTAELEKIRNEWSFLDEMSESVDGFDESCLDGRELSGGFYVQDVWVNRKFRGCGFFKEILERTMRYADLEKDYPESAVVLRAMSENPAVPNAKLEEIYSRYGFETVQDAGADGVIMARG